MPAAGERASAQTVELMTNFAPSFSAEIESLLRSRLGAVSICIAGATAISFVMVFVISGRTVLPVLVLQAVSFAVLLGVIALLYSKRQLSMRQLRIVEMGVFGFAGGCVVAIGQMMTDAEVVKPGGKR